MRKKDAENIDADFPIIETKKEMRKLKDDAVKAVSFAAFSVEKIKLKYNVPLIDARASGAGLKARIRIEPFPYYRARIRLSLVEKEDLGEKGYFRGIVSRVDLRSYICNFLVFRGKIRGF
jgi:hypothetical protein